jgi:hypothetical protein
MQKRNWLTARGKMMKLRFQFAIAILLSLNLCSAASAAVIVNLVGDKDGFGLPGAPAVPADGTLWRDDLGGVFFNDYRTASDLANAPFTDIWTSDPSPSWLHTYNLAGETVIGGQLELQIAGIADFRGPHDVSLNSVVIGQIPTNLGPNGFQEIRRYVFNVAPALLTGLSNASIDISGGDGYSINYSELTVVTQAQAVPEPTTLAIFGLGGLGLAFSAVRRRFRKSA